MLETFMKHYKLDFVQKNLKYSGILKLEDKLLSVIETLGGSSFNNGLYRVCTSNLIDKYSELGEEYFPGLKNKIQVFGFDWLGRLFAIDKRRNNNNESEILLIEPGAGEAMEIPIGIVDFHNIILIQHQNEALASDFHSKWYSNNSINLSFNSCVGYKIPLFLGGADNVGNLEVLDFEVYFSICSQLRQKTLKLNPGQTIKEISIG